MHTCLYPTANLRAFTVQPDPLAQCFDKAAVQFVDLALIIRDDSLTSSV